MTKPQRKPPKPRHYADLPKSRSLNRADEVPSGIKPDPEHPTQSIAAQIAATKAKTPSPADIERKLSTIPPPAPLPTTDAERDAVLVRMAPPVDIAAPTAPRLTAVPAEPPAIPSRPSCCAPSSLASGASLRHSASPSGSSSSARSTAWCRSSGSSPGRRSSGLWRFFSTR
jgi:hypothetical protein